MDVTVVIPAFNAAATIAQAVSSAIQQTLTPREIIVVDDGSADSTAAEVRGLQSRLVSLVSQENAGAAAARNRGVDAARASHIAFLDADDVWHPRKLEFQVECFERFPNTAICRSGMTTGDHDWNMANLGSEVFEENDFRDHFQSPYFGTPNVMIPRELILDVGGFDASLKTAEDLDLFIRILWKNPNVVRIGRILARRLSSKLGLGLHTYKDNLNVIDRFLAEHPEFAADNSAIVDRLKARIFLRYAGDLLLHGKIREGRRAAAESFRHRPSVRAAALFSKSLWK